ncbi:hypothetical protein [Microcoleus sp. BROC3]|uniref:hypothetical protein n=1 Tax=Microcoleus sp. BROC3 TaxID=3055323 RepID=UPI002FCF4544
MIRDSSIVQDIAAAALLSLLALIPQYRIEYPWLFDRVAQMHRHCRETLPPGFETATVGRSSKPENSSYIMISDSQNSLSSILPALANPSELVLDAKTQFFRENPTNCLRGRTV